MQRERERERERERAFLVLVTIVMCLVSIYCMFKVLKDFGLVADKLCEVNY